MNVASSHLSIKYDDKKTWREVEAQTQGLENSASLEANGMFYITMKITQGNINRYASE